MKCFTNRRVRTITTHNWKKGNLADNTGMITDKQRIHKGISEVLAILDVEEFGAISEEIH
jgi:hypothetical protein